MSWIMDHFAVLWMITVAIAGFLTGISGGLFLAICFPKLTKRDSIQSKGGHARALKLSPERRSEIASVAAKARWETKP